jgi:protein-S-isoprenylcysteine O-methyltransferase Ste14
VQDGWWGVLVDKVVVFVGATVGLATVSRASLRDARSHGFYRFFAWEAILVLGLLNLDVWFRDPASWHQIVSWCLLLVSLFLVIHGVHLLRRIGKPDERREDDTLVGFERTTVLVAEGAYRYIRHPLYSSLLFLAWGAFFKAPSWIGGLLAAAATLFLVATARIEEMENAAFFGPDYEAYRKRTKMFVPFLF